MTYPVPPPPTITQSLTTKLRARHTEELTSIEFTPPNITTKQGQLTVIFTRQDYMVTLATRCQYTIIGKFLNTIPRMENISRIFISQTKLRGGVKIVHFNARTVYIDLDNEYDHTTIWTKKFIYIQGQRMDLQAWTPNFNPNEDNPTVLVWGVIPELLWHFYYKEVLSVVLSPIGKVLHLDLASMQKTRGSVAKVKM